MKLVKVKDSIDLSREVESGAIVNTSVDDYHRYSQQKNSILTQKKKIEKLENDVSEIKGMLQLLTNKIINNSK